MTNNKNPIREIYLQCFGKKGKAEQFEEDSSFFVRAGTFGLSTSG